MAEYSTEEPAVQLALKCLWCRRLFVDLISSEGFGCGELVALADPDALCAGRF